MVFPVPQGLERNTGSLSDFPLGQPGGDPQISDSLSKIGVSGHHGDTKWARIAQCKQFSQSIIRPRWRDDNPCGIIRRMGRWKIVQQIHLGLGLGMRLRHGMVQDRLPRAQCGDFFGDQFNEALDFLHGWWGWGYQRDCESSKARSRSTGCPHSGQTSGSTEPGAGGTASSGRPFMRAGGWGGQTSTSYSVPHSGHSKAICCMAI